MRKFSITTFVFFVGALFALTACGAINPQVTPFYTPPAPLPPGKPGEIIKTEKIETNNAQVQAWRVMYHSRDLQGKDVAVTGLFAAPAAPAPEGGYPLLAIAHGTEGLARQCAISLDPWGLPSIAGDYLSFPDTVIAPFVEAGYAVTAPDYQGLGAPGASSYLVGETTAQNIFDSMRAARSFSEFTLSAKNFLWGHSQGGHAVAFAAQLGQTIAPDIPLDGIVMVAPATELERGIREALASPRANLATGLGMMIAGAWKQAYNVPPETIFTEAGIQEAPKVFQDCVIGTLTTFAGKPPATYFKTNPLDTLPWSEILQENTPQTVLYPAPMFVAQGISDIIILPSITTSFVEKMCATQNSIEYQSYEGADHVQVVKASRADIVAWLDARVKNEPAPNNCPTLTQTATITPTTSITPTATLTPTRIITPTVAAVTPIASIPFDGVIFTDGDWTPTQEMIALLEWRLPEYLAQNQNKFNATKPPIVERLAQYKTQYWGEIENGKRVIFVNAMCRAFPDWQTRRIFVADGGDCFFNVKYNADSGTFFDLLVNGEA
jgi:pimeloyl-ACP methyl ester carboxylesterase